MLNEIISTTNSGDMFSGIGRSQSLKDGAFVGLGQFTDDIDPQQKNFMSVLSQFGKGAVQVAPEESKNANSKLAEGRLPNEVNADNASSEKPKGKQGKDCSVAKRLPPVYPDTLGLVMGFLSIPNMPQSDISANTAFGTLGSESEENPASGLIAGGSTPETMKNQQLPDESIILTGIPQIPIPDLSVSDIAQAAQIEASPKLQGQQQPDPSSIADASTNGPAIKGASQVLQGSGVAAQQQENPNSVTVSDPVFSRLDSAQFFKGELMPKLQGQRQPDTSSVKGTSTNSPAISAPAIKGTAQVLQGGEVPTTQQDNTDSVTVSNPVFSRLDSSQFFKGELTQNLQGQRQPDTSSVKDTSPNSPAINGPEIKGTAQVLQGGEVPAQQQENPDSVTVSNPVFSRLDSVQFFNGELTPKLQGQQQPDTSSVKGTSTNGPAINSPAIKGTAQILQSGETPAQLQENSVSITASDPLFSRLDSVQFFNGELTPKLQVQRRSDTSSVKGTSINSPAINGPAAKSTAQVLQSGDMPAQQQENPDSVTASDPVFSKLDTVQLNLSAGKENPGAKGNITQENSTDNVFQDTSVRDKAPTVQKSNSAVRPQEVKAKSGSFHQTGNAIETDGVASPSATVSNADGIGTMDSFKSASSLDMITGSDDDPQLQPPEPASGNSVTNFAKEGQTEKTSSVNSSSNETRPVNQSFHTEVVKQVVDKTASTLKSGQSEMQIDLKPESLGHLRLHVSMENQQVTVKILAENTQVKEMIERQASLIKSELQHQGIKVDAVNVDLLMSGGTDFASSHHEETAFKQARHEPAYSKGQESTGESGFKEPDSPSQANSRGGNLVNYFA
jgi:hypothetical protein